MVRDSNVCRSFGMLLPVLLIIIINLSNGVTGLDDQTMTAEEKDKVR